MCPGFEVRLTGWDFYQVLLGFLYIYIKQKKSGEMQFKEICRLYHVLWGKGDIGLFHVPFRM